MDDLKLSIRREIEDLHQTATAIEQAVIGADLSALDAARLLLELDALNGKLAELLDRTEASQ